MINLLISDPYIDLVDASKLERAALTAVKHESETPGIDIEQFDLSLVIEDDAKLHELNKEFLGIDAPTDVLSFPSGEEDPDPETGHFYLGDIIISYPRANEQSSVAGHAVMDELQLLVVHGVLHLLGHDHAEPEEKAEMWGAQNDILRELGVHLTRLPE